MPAPSFFRCSRYRRCRAGLPSLPLFLLPEMKYFGICSTIPAERKGYLPQFSPLLCPLPHPDLTRLLTHRKNNPDPRSAPTVFFPFHDAFHPESFRRSDKFPDTRKDILSSDIKNDPEHTGNYFPGKSPDDDSISGDVRNRQARCRKKPLSHLWETA